MNRQYIGARYVPKFFENETTGDSSWMAGVSYEALTIVTYNGNSYTSKKPVPSSVGSPNENKNYWVLTGNYNEQLNSVMPIVNISVVSFNNVATLIESNIKKGYLVKTKGYHEINDGGGAYYYITDEKPLSYYISLNNGLYAELIIDDNINVKSFGAYGDNEHDDTNAIQTCINNVSDVKIPTGSYIVNSTINIARKGVKISGVSDSTLGINTTIKYTGNGYLFNLTDANGCSISNLHIIGNGEQNYSNIDGVAINVTSDGYNFYCDNLIIEKIGTGIKLTGVWDTQIKRVKIYYTNYCLDLKNVTNLNLNNVTLYYSNRGINTDNASIVCYDLYNDNCKIGVYLKKCYAEIYKYFSEGGRSSGSLNNTISIEKSDDYSTATIYDFWFYDDSGSHIIAKVDESTTGFIKPIKFMNPNLAGRIFTFDINNDALYGCVIIDAFNINEYTSLLHDKILVNGKYSNYIHGEYTGQGKRKYTGLSSQANHYVVGDCYGRVTLYSEYGVETQFIEYVNNTLHSSGDESTDLLITVTGSNSLVIEHSQRVENYKFEIDLLCSGYLTNSDNTGHH